MLPKEELPYCRFLGHGQQPLSPVLICGFSAIITHHHGQHLIVDGSGMQVASGLLEYACAE